VKVIDLSILVNPLSRLQYLVVDYADDGQVYIYISDAAARSIIVYNVTADKGYRVILPNAVTAGVQRRDVLYMTLVKKSCGTPILYFTYLGSNRMFAIKAIYLRKGQTHGAVMDIGPKQNKIVILGNDNGCAIFFRNKGKSMFRGVQFGMITKLRLLKSGNIHLNPCLYRLITWIPSFVLQKNITKICYEIVKIWTSNRNLSF